MQIEIRRRCRMTQLLFQRFSQAIGRCVGLPRWLSYCRGAHWLYFFLKLLRPYISKNRENLYLFSGESARPGVLSLAPRRRLFWMNRRSFGEAPKLAREGACAPRAHYIYRR